MATKVKPNETIGDHLPILTWQVNRIMKNCQYKDDIKAEWVQWVTGDVKRTSLKSITQAQAKKIIMTQEGSTPVTTGRDLSENWATFDKSNQKHRVILSCMYQAQWTVPSDKYGEIPDMERLSNFLKSDRSPVKKPLKDMQPFELEKVIAALNGIIKSIHK
jgi:hypothetical protein